MHKFSQVWVVAELADHVACLNALILMKRVDAHYIFVLKLLQHMVRPFDCIEELGLFQGRNFDGKLAIGVFLNCTINYSLSSFAELFFGFKFLFV